MNVFEDESLNFLLVAFLIASFVVSVALAMGFYTVAEQYKTKYEMIQKYCEAP